MSDSSETLCWWWYCVRPEYAPESSEEEEEEEVEFSLTKQQQLVKVSGDEVKQEDDRRLRRLHDRQQHDDVDSDEDREARYHTCHSRLIVSVDVIMALVMPWNNKRSTSAVWLRHLQHYCIGKHSDRLTGSSAAVSCYHTVVLGKGHCKWIVNLNLFYNAVNDRGTTLGLKKRTNFETVYNSILLNISDKCHQNRSL